MSMSICLSARVHVSGTNRANFTKFSVHVTHGRDLILFARLIHVTNGAI